MYGCGVTELRIHLLSSAFVSSHGYALDRRANGLRLRSVPHAVPAGGSFCGVAACGFDTAQLTGAGVDNVWKQDSIGMTIPVILNLK